MSDTKRVGWRVLPEPGTDTQNVSLCVLRYVPVYSAPIADWMHSRVVGWPMRSHAERATAPPILRDERIRVGRGVTMRLSQLEALLPYDAVLRIAPDRPPSKLWTKREHLVTATLPSGTVSVRVRTRECDDFAPATDYRGLHTGVDRRHVQAPRAPYGRIVGPDNISRPVVRDRATDTEGR